jgi:hypothetical protein
VLVLQDVLEHSIFLQLMPLLARQLQLCLHKQQWWVRPAAGTQACRHAVLCLAAVCPSSKWLALAATALLTAGFEHA